MCAPGILTGTLISAAALTGTSNGQDLLICRLSGTQRTLCKQHNLLQHLFTFVILPPTHAATYDLLD